MKKTLLLVAVLIFGLATMCQAQTSYWWYDDTGGRSSQTFGWIDESGLEFRALSYDTSFPDYEIGKLELVPRSTGFDLLGGYVAYWPTSEDWFVLPWATINRQLGEANFCGNYGLYTPLTGGSWALCSNETSFTWPVGDFWAGLAGHFWWPEGGPATTLAGLTITGNCDGRYRAAVRWCSLGETYDSWRVTFSADF